MALLEFKKNKGGRPRVFHLCSVCGGAVSKKSKAFIYVDGVKRIVHRGCVSGIGRT